ncbi:hypothetical protein MKW98_003282 [Papaver atlanticum]|uniref:Uncharacterized protein n=1 Tax=Papaver atlanticum TaxID=357466 RepID=A0AAD4T8E5_9MAGN|nr:hypothetical protein MKW98_003282 [Papaver atlanticum]
MLLSALEFDEEKLAHSFTHRYWISNALLACKMMGWFCHLKKDDDLCNDQQANEREIGMNEYCPSLSTKSLMCEFR